MKWILLCAVDVHCNTFVIGFLTANLTIYRKEYVECQDKTEMLKI